MAEERISEPEDTSTEKSQTENQRGKNVTKSKLALLTTRKANQSRDEVLGQGIVALFGKPADGDFLLSCRHSQVGLVRMFPVS